MPEAEAVTASMSGGYAELKFQNLILDASVVLEILNPRLPGNGSRQALEEARRRGCQLWVIAAQLPGVAETLQQTQSDDRGPSDVRKPFSGSPPPDRSLPDFLNQVRVLSSYAYQMTGFTPGADLNTLLLRGGADSLGEGTGILATSGDVLSEDPRAVHPDTFLRASAACPVEGTLPFIDLRRQQVRLLPEIEDRIMGVLRHGQYILGPEIRELELELARYTGVRHAVSCASGTDALLMALLAYGVGPGDAVLTSAFTFIATAEVIALLGATPVFVDIDPTTYNLDAEKLASAVRAVREDDPALHVLPRAPRGPNGRLTPRGIVAVNLFGLPAEYRAINQLAAEQGLFVLEDAAQSFGATYHGKRSCSLTHVGCTSFFPAKPLGCYGDGGAVFTNDDLLAETILSIRVHGQGTDKYDNARLGVNARMDTLQAAILIPKLGIFPDELQSRNRVASHYTQRLQAQRGIQTPVVPPGLVSAWAQYSIQVDGRNEVQKRLKKMGIPTAVYYPRPLHLQNVFAALGYRVGDFPCAESVSGRILSLPMHPYLEESEIQRIVRGLDRAMQG